MMHTRPWAELTGCCLGLPGPWHKVVQVRA